MNKKVILSICIALVVIAAGVCIYLFCIKGSNTEVNYTKLEEDKESIMAHGTVVNAKVKDHDQYSAKIVYEGEGYTVEEYRGGEIVNYKIIIDGKEEWTYDKLYPMTTR